MLPRGRQRQDRRYPVPPGLARVRLCQGGQRRAAGAAPCRAFRAFRAFRALRACPPPGLRAWGGWGGGGRLGPVLLFRRLVNNTEIRSTCGVCARNKRLNYLQAFPFLPVAKGLARAHILRYRNGPCRNASRIGDYIIRPRRNPET